MRQAHIGLCALIVLSVTGHFDSSRASFNLGSGERKCRYLQISELDLTFGTFAARGIDSSAYAESRPDVFWLDTYGNIAWEDEKARLDNFAIELMNAPNSIGYYYIMVGKESCRGEGQARAIRAKDYMTKVRHADWSRIIWRDIGYGDNLVVSIWLSQRGKAPMYIPEYQRATAHHIIENCGVNPLGRQKLNSRAVNRRVRRTSR